MTMAAGKRRRTPRSKGIANARRSKTCVYCGSTAKISGEHVINHSVFREFFGAQMGFIVQHPEFGEKDNRVDRLRDVCESCNNKKLQPYDNAALIFAKSVNTLRVGVSQTLPFSVDVLGWLVKTHLNILRKYSNWYPCLIHRQLYDHLRDHRPIPAVLYRLVFSVFLEDRKLYQTKRGELALTWKVATTRYQVQRIMRSYFRLRNLETFLYLPDDAVYRDFPARVSEVLRTIYPPTVQVPLFDSNSAIKTGHISILAQ